MKTTSCNVNKGFTLIELLVVIAIIAILSAIMFPVFAQVKAKARQTECISNHRQIAQAVMMYKDDSDGRFPLCRYQSGKLMVWPVIIQPHIRNDQVFVEPSNPSRTKFRPPLPAPKTLEGQFIGMGINSELCLGIHEARIQNHSETILFCDTAIHDPLERNPFEGWGFYISWFTDTKVREPCSTAYTPASIGFHAPPTNVHQDGAVVTFIDGHVKWKNTATLRSPPENYCDSWRLWYPTAP